MTTRPTLRQWADQLAALHEDFYRKKPMSELMPMFFLDGEDGMDVVSAIWRDPLEKALILEEVRRRLRNPKITRYALSCEAWTVRQAVGVSDEAVSMAQAGRLSEHPDRVEVVSTICVDRAIPQPVSVVQEILRGRSGGVRLLKRMESNMGLGPALIGGSLATLFGEPTRQ